MTNIHDVARLSGYSVSTVSRVLNHKDYVTTETRAAVQKVIDELDYVPNDVARDLSRGKTMTIGVILPNLDHPYFVQLIQGITKAAFVADYHVILLSSRFEAEIERTYLAAFRRKAYDALIFTSHGLPLAEIATYQKYGPIVICQPPRDSGLSAAYAHRRQTYVQALTTLKVQGCQRVALLMSRPIAVSETSQATAEAYRIVYGESPRPAMLATDVITMADGQRAAERFIASGQTFEAIFANSDDIAVGVQRAYQQAKLPVPVLIGQEHQLSGELAQFPTIDHHCQIVGQQALQLAVSGEKRRIAIDSEFINNW
ncbi:LacI family DNA-binding transcriptional regulator [Lactiplantibacillus sp. WILCCON 0030]|uniref:LacI family DNA-binding transcriptional regulator n=2 Tax=Lactiplantibacillus brownii TaxID=3069269 RepID=A0ABU1ACC6_9LACO|nr:LacI family DNA-binding transcriptional regulator [Lactiplantibacillus brownii]MDQ7938599.1 LacI family DNA-binding transcriptional regulator [Lactiplantibacillus brownii]